MAFIDNMRDKLSQAGQTTVQKAKELSEIARLNGVIASSEKQIGELYSQIGYAVYCAYNKEPLPEAAEMINQVTELLQNIDTCKAQIKAINAADTCPQCGAKTGKGMAFCSSCGCKLPVVVEQPVVDAVPVCSQCGAAYASDSLFCASCGNKLG